MMNTLQINNLTKTYANGVKAMQNISMQISNGIFGLLGPNGAGKSTLMRTIAGLQQPDSGRIIFNDTDVVARPVLIKQHLGYLPQDFGVYPQISAYDLLEHLAVLKGITSSKGRRDQILALLEKTNLYAHRHKAVSAYSGGMRQRFGVAQALLGNPRIIIVDEPTAGLDPEERNRFNNLLSEISEQIIIILSTHLVEDVRHLCTQMAIINKGNLLAYGQPDTFIDQLRGRIWTQTIDRQDLPAFRAQYQVISAQLHAGKQSVHVYAEANPGNGFAARQPDLEDVYFTQLYHTK
jgi:ABC-2 type transport system ATP-binding protein